MQCRYKGRLFYGKCSNSFAVDLAEVLKLASMSKTVLVSFKERNKVLRVNCATAKEEISLLKKQFCRAFNEPASQGKLITFQRFDEAWGCFVDLDEHADTIEDKDKLNVVVTECPIPAGVEIEPSSNSAEQMDLSVSA